MDAIFQMLLLRHIALDQDLCIFARLVIVSLSSIPLHALFLFCLFVLIPLRVLFLMRRLQLLFLSQIVVALVLLLLPFSGFLPILVLLFAISILLSRGPPLHVATFPPSPPQETVIGLINIRAFFLNITLRLNVVKLILIGWMACSLNLLHICTLQLQAMISAAGLSP
jgi:hypothetical protein